MSDCILLVDDERLALDELEYTVHKVIPDSELVLASSGREALEKTAGRSMRICFLDIELQDMSGIELAEQLKAGNPQLNVIFVTAYDQFAVDAFRAKASGYVLKPVSEKAVREELTALRFPIRPEEVGVFIQCFGKFEVFARGKPMEFSRSACKEILAYLIDLKGASTNTEELCGILWPELETSKRRRNYLRVLLSDLRNTLQEYGVENILVKKRNSFAVDMAEIRCDYYDYLAGIPEAVERFRGEYMIQYSWAEETMWELNGGMIE